MEGGSGPIRNQAGITNSLPLWACVASTISPGCIAGCRSYEGKVTYQRPRGPSAQKRCWCGSGRKEKNCHGIGSDAKSPAGSRATSLDGSGLQNLTKKPEAILRPWGMPGEEHKIIVAPIFRGEESNPRKMDLAGGRSRYCLGSAGNGEATFSVNEDSAPSGREFSRHERLSSDAGFCW